MIPRVIYTFWDGETCPIVEQSLSRLHKVNPDCRLARLTRADIPRRDGLSDLRLSHISDWVRLWYLTKHGGVWMDASCVCAGPVSN